MAEMINKENRFLEMLEEMRELKKAIDKVEKDIDKQVSNIKSFEGATLQLEAYKKAINKIDDFFEYANSSISDRRRVHEILDNLTSELKEICSPKHSN